MMQGGLIFRNSGKRAAAAPPQQPQQPQQQEMWKRSVPGATAAARKKPFGGCGGGGGQPHQAYNAAPTRQRQQQQQSRGRDDPSWGQNLQPITQFLKRPAAAAGEGDEEGERPLTREERREQVRFANREVFKNASFRGQQVRLQNAEVRV